MRRVAPNQLSLIFDESEWNNCFIIYTRSDFINFTFRIFSIFFYLVYVFIFALSADYFFKNILYILTILNFKNSFSTAVTICGNFFIVFLISCKGRKKNEQLAVAGYEPTSFPGSLPKKDPGYEVGYELIL
jgi:hypothetical protein